MRHFLDKFESWLRSAAEGREAAAGDSPQPLDVARQIRREIERNKRVFINEKVYVAHHIVVHLHTPDPRRREEYEALFSHADFRKYVEDYIREKGYSLLDRLRVEIRCHMSGDALFKRGSCHVEFAWPLPETDPGEVTVALDPRDKNRILAVYAPKSEIPVEAWLFVMDGRAVRDSLRVHCKEFFIGRVEAAGSRGGGQANHLSFLKPEDAEDPNHWVSRHHARIRFKDGVFHLADVGSRNGTWVERGGELTALSPVDASDCGVQLQDGDMLIIGKARVRFRLVKPPETTPDAFSPGEVTTKI